MGARTRAIVATALVSALLTSTAVSPVDATGEEPPADQVYAVPSGDWVGAIFFDGTRTSSGLSEVGQQTDIFQRVDGTSIGLQTAMGSGDRGGYVEAGTANVSIDWSESATFGSRTVNETGTLQVSGDVTRFEVAGTLERALSASDSEGNPIGSVSGTTVIEVNWVFELVEVTCGLFEYRLSEDSTGGSFLWFAQRPRQETGTAGFDISHDLTVRAVLQAPGGPDFANLATDLQQVEEAIGQVVADPNDQNVQLLLAEIVALEAIGSRFIEAGTCVTFAQATFLANGLSVLQELIAQMIGVVLQQKDLPLDVLVEVLGIGVRVRAIAPGIGGTGQELFDAIGAELGEQLGVAIGADDIDTITDIYVVAVQYGFDALVAVAGDALGLGGSDQ